MSLKALARQAIANGGSVATMERPEVDTLPVPAKPPTTQSVHQAVKQGRGKPSIVLSPQDKETLLQAFRDGYPVNIACLAIGRDASAVGMAIGNDEHYADLCKKAMFDGVRSLRDDVRNSTRWQAAAWQLERMHPEMFALKSDLRVSPSVTVNVTVSKADCDKLARDFAQWIEADSVTPVSQDNVNP